MTTLTPEERRLARKDRRHLIAEVRFQWAAEQGLPEGAAPLLCSCGTWTTSGGWSEHRGLSQDQLRVLRAHRAADERRRVA
jgi:hypothetical protein